MRSSRAYIAVGCIAGVFAAALAAVLFGGRGLVSFDTGWPDSGGGPTPELVAPGEIGSTGRATPLRPDLAAGSPGAILPAFDSRITVRGVAEAGREARPRRPGRGRDPDRPDPASVAPAPPPPPPAAEPSPRPAARANTDDDAVRETGEDPRSDRGRGRGNGRGRDDDGERGQGRGRANAAEPGETGRADRGREDEEDRGEVQETDRGPAPDPGLVADAGRGQGHDDHGGGDDHGGRDDD